MTKTKKIFVLKGLLVLFISLVFSLNSFSWIYHNHGGDGYGDGGDNAGDKANSIEAYIIEGAGYFIIGYSDVLTLLNRFEISDLEGVNYDELQEIVDRVLSKLYKTKVTYKKLIEAAENTPYNEVVIEKLISFNYELFMDNNSLIPGIFKEVEVYLKKGDITGTFKKSYTNFDNIISILNTIREEVVQGRMPNVANLWKLNQVYAGELLFGQYNTQVFNAL